MAAEKATALVLRVTEFSETSSVVTLYTREFGKVRALAKGARRLKGPFESALDLLALCRIVFLAKSTDALDLLTEAKLERRFRPPGRDLASLYGAYYVAELLTELTDENDSNPELFDAADQTLIRLSRGGSVASLILHFELITLKILGHLPSLEMCVECGTRVDTAGRVAFAPLAGGVLCANCRSGQRKVVSVSTGVIRELRQFSIETLESEREQPLERSLRGELRAVLNHYLNHLLGRRLRMHDYLGTFCN